MIITQLDAPLTAEEARQISLNNRDESIDRSKFRELMQQIKYEASYGRTRYTSALFPRAKQWMPSEYVYNALRSMGYKVIEKRAYKWDSEKKELSTTKPELDHAGNETFFVEITWG